MTEIPDDIHEAAIRAVDEGREDFLLAKISDNTANLRKVAIAVVEKAIVAERVRIIGRLLEEADVTPCAEDAIVTRSNARLIEADFSYEDAERISDERESLQSRLDKAEAELDALREALFMCAASCQGSHSIAGLTASELLNIPFPISMENLVIAAPKFGLDPAKLWPWYSRLNDRARAALGREGA